MAPMAATQEEAVHGETLATTVGTVARAGTTVADVSLWIHGVEVTADSLVAVAHAEGLAVVVEALVVVAVAAVVEVTRGTNQKTNFV